MADTGKPGSWVRRFLLEHLIGERNLSVNTQRSYRDTLALLIPFAAREAHKKVDELAVADVSEKCVGGFLANLEGTRGCAISSRNQRLAAIHAFSHFVAAHSPEHIEWCGQIRAIPFKKCTTKPITYLEKPAMDACWRRRTSKPLKDSGITSCCCSFTIPARAPVRRLNFSSETSIWGRCRAGTCRRSRFTVRAGKNADVRSGRKLSKNCVPPLAPDNRTNMCS